MRIHRLGILIIAALVAFVLAGCGGKVPPALVASAPTSAETANAQRMAKDIAVGATVGVNLIRESGGVIDVLPIPDAQKDKYDCAVMRLLGIDQPSATNLRICGPLPKVAETELTKARETLQRVTACPSLRSTTAVIMGLVTPLIAQLSWGDNPVLGFSSRAIAFAFDNAKQFLEGGGECSPQ